MNPSGIIEEAQRRRARVSLDGGVGLFFADAYRAKLGKGALHMTLPTTVDGIQPAFSYRLGSVAAGQEVLYQDEGQAIPAVAERDTTLAYRHAAVDELYEALPGAVEQSFRLSSPPRDAADLEIRGRVETNLDVPADGTRADALTFRKGGRDVIVVSQCAAVDAKGDRLPLPLGFESGDLVIRVPADWMAAAAYPIVVDPLVGSAITIKAGLADLFVRSVDVTYNATQNHYFIVWNEKYSDGPDGLPGTDDDDFDVWAARLDAATGTFAAGGPPNPGPLDTDEGQAGECATAWNATLNQYLTVYRHNLNIRGRITSGNGTNVPASSNAGFIISETSAAPLSLRNPDVAAYTTYPNGWRVVWQGFVGATTYAILGRDVTGVDEFVNDFFVVALADLGETVRPAVAYNATTGNFLIGWDTSGNAPGECYVRTATVADPPEFGEVRMVSVEDTTSSGLVRIAANPSAGEFLCCWQDDVDPAAPDAVVRAGRTDGTGLPTGGQITVGSGVDFEGRPDVAYNPPNDMYMIVWHRLAFTSANLTAGDIMVSIYRANLALREGPFAVTTTADIEFFPACAASTTAAEGLIAWVHQMPTTPVTFNIEANRYALPFLREAPVGLVQSDVPDGPPMPVGFADGDPNVSFRATIPDVGVGETARVQFEVKPNGTAFDSLGLLEGNLVSSAPGVSQATSAALINGAYHWRARAIDTVGRTSSWVEFDAGPAPDFSIEIGRVEGRDNANGNLGFNDYRCLGGVSAGTSGGLLWSALLLSALLAFAGRARGGRGATPASEPPTPNTPIRDDNGEVGRPADKKHGAEEREHEHDRETDGELDGEAPPPTRFLEFR